MSIEEIKPGLFIQQTATGNYRMVRPIRKDSNLPFNFKTNCNYTNLILGGSWTNFFTIVFIISIIMYATWGYAYDTKQCREIISDPIGFCHDSNACIVLSQSVGLRNEFQNIDFNNNNNEHNLSLPT